MELIEGIIIKTQKYKEDSKIIHVITKNGLVCALGRGCLKIKSKNFYILQEITKIAIDLHVKSNSFNIIKSTKLLDNYSTIKLDSKKLETVLEILEITNVFSEHITDYITFYIFLNDILDKIKNSINTNLYKLIFKIKMLYLLGIAPEFSSCINCGKKNNLIGFDFESGGMKCEECFDIKKMLKYDIFVNFKTLYLTKLYDIKDEINIDNFDECDNFVDSYYEKYLGYNIKTSNIFKKINNTASRS